MPDIKYKKIELHSAEDLVKEREEIEYEKELVEKLMIENQIEFAIEIERKKDSPLATRRQNIIYSLMLIVKEEDFDRVIEILDKAGNLGYVVDLDETFDLDEESEESQNQNDDAIISKIELPEELKEEEIDDDPIKSYGEEDYVEDLAASKIKFEPKLKSIEYKSFPKFILKLFLSIAYTIILIPELLGIIYGIQEGEYEIATTMFVFIVIETPIFLGLYNALNKKNK